MLSSRGRFGGHYAGIGRLAPESVAKLAEESGSQVSSVDTSCWTLHTNETGLLGLIPAISELPGTEVILFHNFPGRLKKFIKKNGLSSCRALEGTEYTLS